MHWAHGSVRTFAVALGALGTLLLSSPAAGGEVAAGAERVRLVADWDDDDGDGIPDWEQDQLDHPVGQHPLVLPPAAARAAAAVEIEAGTPVKLRVDGRALGDGARLPARYRRISLQATGPGRGRIRIGARHFEVSALAVYGVDSRGRVVDLTRSHASLQRTPPRRLGAFLSTAATDAVQRRARAGCPRPAIAR